MTSTWAHFKELRLFFKMSPISSIRLEDTNLQTWGWWTKSFPWFAWIFVILGGPWFLWKYRWAMKTISAHAGDGITTKKLVPDPFFQLDLPTLVTASWRRNKTRPDTRQSSRGWLGRSSNAKIAWYSKMLRGVGQTCWATRQGVESRLKIEQFFTQMEKVIQDWGGEINHKSPNFTPLIFFCVLCTPSVCLLVSSTYGIYKRFLQYCSCPNETQRKR